MANGIKLRGYDTPLLASFRISLIRGAVVAICSVNFTQARLCTRETS